MRMYIAGPYSANHPRQVLRNVDAAIEAGIKVITKGHSVFIPHYTHYMHLHSSCPFEYEEYLRNDIEWLKVSDAMLFLSPSPGANMELELAKKLGLRIYYFVEDIEDISGTT